MENVLDIFSKFRDSLDDIIVDYKNRLSDIEAEEDFIQLLGDVVNYSKSDYLLLPFYDETILARVFERVFPLSSTELNKVKTLKYLIDSSKSIDVSNFPQYNETADEVKKINDKLEKFYKKLLSDDSLKNNKIEYSDKVDRFSKVFDLIGENGFNSLIDDIDLFEECINECNLDIDDINVILNVAIGDNLKYLDASGVISVDVHEDIADMKKQNDRIQDEISDLSNLLGNE